MNHGEMTHLRRCDPLVLAYIIAVYCLRLPNVTDGLYKLQSIQIVFGSVAKTNHTRVVLTTYIADQHGVFQWIYALFTVRDEARIQLHGIRGWHQQDITYRNHIIIYIVFFLLCEFEKGNSKLIP